MVFDQSKKKQKKCPKKTKKSDKKKQNFLEKINKYFFKKTKFSFEGGNIFFQKQIKHIFKKKKKVSKLSVLKNGHFQCCPHKSIGNGTFPSPRYLHTLSQKKNFFLNFIIYGENKEGGRSPSAQKKQNFGPTEIFGRWGGRRVQKLAEW